MNLTRAEFREEVFARDKNKCVMCPNDAQDAHHIIERKLWDDDGYHLNNGASLCGECHILAEQTVISVEDIREAAGILKWDIPQQLYSDYKYDKWGNICLPNGTRLKGPLFYDESTQKILKSAGLMDIFIDYVKYPRTYHLPNSPTVNKDDRQLQDYKNFEGKRVVVTVKMDGENTTMYNDNIHARSLDSRHHASRDWVKNLHGKIAYDIPYGWRICGENLYAKHSIHYKDLDSYFQVFSIWNEKNMCLSWDMTTAWANIIGLPIVPVIFKDTFDKDSIQDAYDEYCEKSSDEVEGYVVRIEDEFSYGDFKNCMAKYVRANHVQTHGHWMRAVLEPNKLAK